MPVRPNAVASEIQDFPSTQTAAQSDDTPLSVRLTEGPVIHFDASDPKAPALHALLQAFQRYSRTIYFTLKSDASTIDRVYLPLLGQVLDLKERSDGTIECELSCSQALFLLLPAEHYFDDIKNALNRATRSEEQVLVVIGDHQNIIDVQQHHASEQPEGRLPEENARIEIEPLKWWQRLWEQFRKLWKRICKMFGCNCISEAQAQALFEELMSLSCPIPEAPASLPGMEAEIDLVDYIGEINVRCLDDPARPCIPFDYLLSGCWARSHEIARIMLEKGYHPKKVSIRDSLRVRSSKSVSCQIAWIWHIAPTLCVRRSLFDWEEKVFDPALFNRPASKTEWKTRLGAPDGTLLEHPHTLYSISPEGIVRTDPNYEDTHTELCNLTGHLLKQVIDHGPPPYECPPNLGEIVAPRPLPDDI